MYNQILNLVDEIDYKKDDVAIKMILEEEDNSIRLIALDEKQQIPEHSVPTHACAYVLEGIIDFTIGGDYHSLRKGEMIIMPKTVIHSLFARTRAKMLLIRI